MCLSGPLPGLVTLSPPCPSSHHTDMICMVFNCGFRFTNMESHRTCCLATCLCHGNLVHCFTHCLASLGRDTLPRTHLGPPDSHSGCVQFFEVTHNVLVVTSPQHMPPCPPPPAWKQMWEPAHPNVAWCCERPLRMAMLRTSEV